MAELLKQDKFFINHMNDLMKRAETTYGSTFSGFLNMHEQSILMDLMKNHSVSVLFDGGYEMAERRIASFIAKGSLDDDTNNKDGISGHNYSFLQIALPKIGIKRMPNHRDFLGTLMNLGVERKLIGDILIFDSYAVVICLKEIADFIINNLDRVGNIAVHVEIIDKDDQWRNYKPNFKRVKSTVASIRLDSVIKASTKLTRSASDKYIKSGKVFVNGKEVTSSSKELCEDDVISVRGIGKFILTSIGNVSKKKDVYI